MGTLRKLAHTLKTIAVFYVYAVPFLLTVAFGLVVKGDKTMNVLELSEKIEAEGYELKSIRRFKNSFHINYWTPNAKMQLFIKVPLNSVQWRDLKPHFPKVLEVSNKQ